MKNSNEGFTLVELMAVIIILAIIGLIIFPTAIDSIDNAKEKLYKEQVDRIITAADSWAASHDNLLSEDKITKIKAERLKKDGLLKNETIKNPLHNKDTMDDDIIIYFDSEYNQYASLYCDLTDGKKYYEDGNYYDAVVKQKCREAETVPYEP